MLFCCIGEIPEDDRSLETVSNLAIGDRLLLRFNLTAQSIYACFVETAESNWTSDVDHHCIVCNKGLYNHLCDSTSNASSNTVIDHGFQASFYYYACPLSYFVTFYKYEMNLSDSGSIIFAKSTGGDGYHAMRTVHAKVSGRRYTYVPYVVVTGVVLVLVGVILFVVCFKRRNRKPSFSPPYYSECY